ncbi:MAG: 23S rRNA (uracil(1939)-C(5))-methyltransferase RlmD [Candidatus Sumerlaeaceae bacterium]|nr:23S rRNA (uracil(1939)-C(5))-methyltransferase RlmD [Candidatus Sumerlaeaceae bacterium]
MSLNKPSPPPGPRKGARFTATIEDLAFGGKGIARIEGLVIFMERVVPGDVVSAVVTRRKPQYAEAKVLEVITPSPRRQTPPCPVFGTCGGCKWQNLPYEEQLAVKQQHVAEALRHIGRLQEYTMHSIIPSPDPWNYRNKMEFSFGLGDTGRIEIGLHKAGDFRRVVEVDKCLIQPTVFDEIVAWFSNKLNEFADQVPPYNPVRHTGFLRHLLLRHSQTTGEFLVALLTASGDLPDAEDLADAFMTEFPKCRGFIWGTNDGLSDVARMEKLMLQRGPNTITETLGQRTFRISTFSFFQTNTRGGERLYDTVKRFAGLTGTETVLDAYCGTGSIGIYLADGAAKVVGIELVADAVEDARHNAEGNGVTNCEFHTGDMHDVLDHLQANGALASPFDVVIVDPPRGGMDKKALRDLINLRAPRLIYVSCNPTTLARDSVELAEAGYTAEEVQPVDMFPHTFHVESVIRFRHSTAPR